jgi:DNA-binding response OmpR family regulator
MRLATAKPPAARLPQLSPQEAARSIAFDLVRAEDELARGNDNIALVLLALARSTAEELASRFAGDRFEIGDLVVDLPARQALLRGRPVELSRKAFDLLAVLASDPERVWPRRVLYERAWGTDLSGTSRALDAAAKRLRACLGPSWVHVSVGVGDRLTAPRPHELAA